MTPRISIVLDSIRQILDLGAEGVPFGIEQFQRASHLVDLCAGFAREMEGQLTVDPVSPELLADGKVISLKTYLEAKSHVQS
ncbi:hypothetical protein HB780_06165 (plasmid) [Rhizobium lusitanum]|uniref:hypothetical protein n=1 Tax=Rhizobium lusitanum TaxID=293958 RepID=UPI001620E67D|nr:hypothetical protein [Rhizobium lusitanum]QND45331.1 hypothetical protein HB780_06165 [Rhizobium lusitanum]